MAQIPTCLLLVFAEEFRVWLHLLKGSGGVATQDRGGVTEHLREKGAMHNIILHYLVQTKKGVYVCAFKCLD